MARGVHVIRHWSATQKCVATYTAESEVIALAKAVSELRGMQHRAREWGLHVSGVHAWSDAQATLDFVSRNGAGRQRHVHLAALWLQKQKNDDCEQGAVTFGKINGTENPSDCLTKSLGRTSMDRCLDTMGFVRRSSG